MKESRIHLYHGWSSVTCARNFSVKSRCLVRAGLQTRAPFTMKESPSGKPVRRVKMETVGRVVNSGRMDYRARVWRPARTEPS